MIRYRSVSATVINIVFNLLIGASAEDRDTDCTLPKDSGQRCSDGEEQRAFYYSSQYGICQPFAYHGCGGNSNRFTTADECKSTCAAAIKSSSATRGGAKSSQWIHADKCNATHLIPDGEYFECETKDGSGHDAGCPNGHVCAADGICCPTKEHVCSLRDDSGTFAEGIDDRPRFAWSAEIQSCWRFSYYGAKGNYNNFPNFNKCVAFCRQK